MRSSAVIGILLPLAALLAGPSAASAQEWRLQGQLAPLGNRMYGTPFEVLSDGSPFTLRVPLPTPNPGWFVQVTEQQSGRILATELAGPGRRTRSASPPGAASGS